MSVPVDKLRNGHGSVANSERGPWLSTTCGQRCGSCPEDDAEVLVSDHDQVWTAAAQLLRAQVSEAVWLSTFQDAYPIPDVDDVIRIGVPSTHAREKITTKYLPLVEDALAEIGAGSRRLVVEVYSGSEAHDDPSPTELGRDRGYVSSGDHTSVGSAAVAALSSSPAPNPNPNLRPNPN